MRPCPFCGKTDDLSRNLFSGDFVCDACGASVDEGSWNNRPVEDALREALEFVANAYDMEASVGDNSLAFYEAYSVARAALNRANTGDQQ